MIVFRPFSLFSLFFFFPWGAVQGYARVIENALPSDSKKEQTSSTSAKKSSSLALSDAQKILKPYHHMLSGSLALRRLDIDDYSYGAFNDRPIQNIDEKSLHDLCFDYAFAYHYRPAAAYSLGFSFDRLQVNNSSIDLRYKSVDPIAPEPDDLERIASDLISDLNTYAIANYYQPLSIGNRGYAYEGVFRAYVVPKWSTDPFFQVTMGYTHNRGHVEREDGSRSITSSDQLWTWSVGSGFYYQLDSAWRIETLMMIRNQKKMQFGDRISAPSQNAQYAFSAYADRYYSTDLKISLCRTW
jgi:hypothetical protein